MKNAINPNGGYRLQLKCGHPHCQINWLHSSYYVEVCAGRCKKWFIGANNRPILQSDDPLLENDPPNDVWLTKCKPEILKKISEEVFNVLSSFPSVLISIIYSYYF